MESVLFHGSNKIIEAPTRGGGRVHNDYGQGFYCTPDLALAREWACSESPSAFVNHYSFEPSFEPKLCNLGQPPYHALNWLAVLMKNRIFTTRHRLANEVKEYILGAFLPDLSGFDIIRGYRADDSYFDMAESFLTGAVTLRQLTESLRLGNLGEQIFLQSESAFEALVFTSAEYVEKQVYYPLRIQRDRQSRRAFQKMKGAGLGADGILAIDILREKWKNDDPRLR